MNSNILFAFTVIMPVAVSVIFSLFERFTKFKNIKSIPKQVIIGTVFSGVAVLATVWGFQEEASVISVRDAAPVCASFIFGPVAGVISAVAGAAYRLISGVVFGSGFFSAYSCSLSTLIIGIAAALTRKIRKENRISMFFTVVFCIVAESMHMLLIFLTNFDMVTAAYQIVSSCFLPMVTFTTLSVSASVLFSAMISGDLKGLFISRKERGISDVMERMLVAGMVAAYLFTGFFTYIMQLNSAIGRSCDMLDAQTESIMDNLDVSVKHHILKEMMDITYNSAHKGDGDAEGPAASTEYLQSLCEEYSVSRIDLLSSDNIVLYSSDEKQKGNRITDDEFTSDLNRDGYYVDTLIYDEKEYCSARIIVADTDAYPSGVNYLRMMYDKYKIQNIIKTDILTSSFNFQFGNAGVVLITDNKPDENNRYHVIKPYDREVNIDIPDYIDFPDTSKTGEGELAKVEYNGEPCFMLYYEKNDLFYITLLNENSALLGSRISIMISLLMEVLIFTLASLILYVGIRKHVVSNLRSINSDLGKICRGDLDVTVNVRSNKEFSILSDDINSTVDTLKEYIDAEAARIDDELTLAHSIQTSSLPRVFPPFPNHREFDIYALMTPAREVGGDFYDFFFVNKNTLAFVIADVSGKGIPGALFMMTARTTLKQLALQGKSLDEVFDTANRELFESNPSRVFVTAWMGMLNIQSGELNYVNAGHNPPLLLKDGKFEYLKVRTGFVLAGRKNSRYRYGTITLSPNDCLLLYTDGVTESVNSEKVFYGEDRLKTLANKNCIANPKKICESIFEDVNAFSSGCEQADDITVMCITYNGNCEGKVYEHRFTSDIESTAKAIAFVKQSIEENNISDEIISAFQVCTDELFSNIVKYAYPEDGGDISVRVEIFKKRVVLTLSDSGIPFDPLSYINSEIDVPARKRKPGGLGIFLVKKLMDDVEYSHENGENSIAITKMI